MFGLLVLQTRATGHHGRGNRLVDAQHHPRRVRGLRGIGGVASWTRKQHPSLCSMQLHNCDCVTETTGKNMPQHATSTHVVHCLLASDVNGAHLKIFNKMQPSLWNKQFRPVKKPCVLCCLRINAKKPVCLLPSFAHAKSLVSHFMWSIAWMVPPSTDDQQGFF